MKIFATDLDGTVLFSNKVIHDITQFVPVDASGEYIGYLHKELFFQMDKLNQDCLFVPVTTRSREQYERIAFPIVPKFALACNGSVLYIDGKEDKSWYQESLDLLSDCKDALQELAESWSGCRWVANCFLYAVYSSIEEAKRMEWVLHVRCMCENYFHVYRKERKVYVIPICFEKGESILRLKKKFPEITYVLCAGDSDIDKSLLQVGDKLVALDRLKEKGVYNE